MNFRASESYSLEGIGDSKVVVVVAVVVAAAAAFSSFDAVDVGVVASDFGYYFVGSAFGLAMRLDNYAEPSVVVPGTDGEVQVLADSCQDGATGIGSHLDEQIAAVDELLNLTAALVVLEEMKKRHEQKKGS